MALETWLIKMKKTITHSFDSVRSTPPKKTQIKKSNVAVLAFEIAGLMSKLLHLWQSLSEKNVVRLRHECICLEGVRKIVSNDDAFLLGLACAELVENLRLVAKSISRISKKCENSSLRSFEHFFDEFANKGRDSNNWVLGSKEMESKIKKLDRFITSTNTLHREIDELLLLENSLKKLFHHHHDQALVKEQKVVELQQKIQWQKQEIKYLKNKSLWCRSHDSVTSLLARCVFTILARIKLVFGVGANGFFFPSSLPRCLSASALVYPSENHNTCGFVSGPLMKTGPNLKAREGFFESNSKIIKKPPPSTLGSACGFVSGPLMKIGPNLEPAREGFFELNSKIIKNPPQSTLGSAALALLYANLIIVMEKMIKSPQLVGVDARDDLYSMLPNSIRFGLRARLKGVGFSASDPRLAGEWRDALQKILGWLSPLAHNMIKWQSERSFEQQNLVQKTNVLLLQTLYFANQDKAEAAITELLVGLNYIWRFEGEMNAKAIFQFTNFNGLLNSSQAPS